jgi:ribonucleases P/MRP protein subunit RPP40
MLSEGSHGVDDVFSLKDGKLDVNCTRLFYVVRPPNAKALVGILTLSLGKESYERAGLAGKPDGIKGMRGTRHRWSKDCPHNFEGLDINKSSC